MLLAISEIIAVIEENFHCFKTHALRHVSSSRRRRRSHSLGSLSILDFIFHNFRISQAAAPRAATTTITARARSVPRSRIICVINNKASCYT